jgi:hypothetical protein
MKTVVVVLAAGAWARAACGQVCEQHWSREFAIGVGGEVYSAHAGSERVYVGGRFTSAGGVEAARVAAYTDRAWSALGPGIRFGQGCWAPLPLTVRTLLEVDLPTVAGVIAGGNMSITGAGGMESHSIARWDGAGWRPMGDGLAMGLTDTCGGVRDLAVFDDGGGAALYASGLFHVPAGGLARWNGASWDDVGGRGLGGFIFDGGGNAMAAHDDGTGPALYVGGSFTLAGSTPVSNVARWSPGAGWEALGDGLDFVVEALVEFEDEGQSALLAAGGEGATGQVHRWDGASWSRMGGMFDSRVLDIAIFDDGGGPALYVAGEFSAHDGRPARRLARWDENEWVEVAGGVGGAVHALEPVVHDGVWTLMVGGSFATVGNGVVSPNIARLIGCGSACDADCDGSGDLTFFDFLCFQNLFAAMESQADCDASGELDFFDFLCFQNAFAAGCP